MTMIAAILLGFAIRMLVLTHRESRPGNCWPLMPDARARMKGRR